VIFLPGAISDKDRPIDCQTRMPTTTSHPLWFIELFAVLGLWFAE